LTGKQRKIIDEIDLQILDILQSDCRIPLEDIASKLGIPKSTIHYRIKRLEDDKTIKGYRAEVDATKVGRGFLTITSIRAKYGPKYHHKVGKMLAGIPGVSAIYLVFGEIDFVVLTRSKNSDDFMRKLERVINMPEIERSSTEIVAETMKFEQKIDLINPKKLDPALNVPAYEREENR
jgi:DNA-binding Lrp family transcriptional regulator